MIASEFNVNVVLEQSNKSWKFEDIFAMWSLLDIWGTHFHGEQMSKNPLEWLRHAHYITARRTVTGSIRWIRSQAGRDSKSIKTKNTGACRPHRPVTINHWAEVVFVRFSFNTRGYGKIPGSTFASYELCANFSKYVYNMVKFNQFRYST